MLQSIRLGTVRGIPVGVHWSVLLILFLLVDALAVGLLPASAGGQATAAYWVTAAWAALLFLAALLAHELAHAVTAQRFRIRVESITLWAFGGVSVMAEEARRPPVDLLIALAGPFTSLGAAAVFAAASVPADLAGSELTRQGLLWLAQANLVLAVFNLLPGAPLDGGRALAAILWWIRGDRAAARRTASRSGMVLGLLLAGAGAALVAGSAALDGLWLVLLGWYLARTARTEQAAAALTESLRGLSVADAMTAPAVCGYAGHTVRDFAERTARPHPHHLYPVVDIDGRFAGLVTVATLTAVAPDRRLADVMIPRSEAPAVQAAAPLLEAVGALNTPVRTVVVLERDHPSGVLTAGDVARLMGVARLGATRRPLERRP
ncbi:site-2 protease family protein [Actinoplanes sp. NPDC049802]|uniref:site-2 protease family protein n=1 Tax=Actinoplanes sp. NPDC049802 TaxID=3154742 RepID=UPI0033D05A8C